jgi:hypothetical protein
MPTHADAIEVHTEIASAGDSFRIFLGVGVNGLTA